MTRQKKPVTTDLYSGSETGEPFGRMYASVMKSDKYKNLSLGARNLYACCRAHAATKESRQCLFKHGKESGNKYIVGRDFVFPAAQLENYGIERANASRWFDELERAGFIERRERNKNMCRVNVYSFSARWRGP